MQQSCDRKKEIVQLQCDLDSQGTSVCRQWLRFPKLGYCMSSNLRYFILHFKCVYSKSQFVYNSIHSISGVEKKPQEENEVT